MKYASVFATIVIVWLAVVIIALFGLDTAQRMQLFVLVTIFTLILFFIGFRKRR